MADPISLTSGLLALVSFALTSSKTLYEVVIDFRGNKKHIRELREELVSLQALLESLARTIELDQFDLSLLKVPLERCAKACDDFAISMKKCSSHSDGPKNSVRDFTRFTYMGKDIRGLRDLINGYKSTIAIALADANLRFTAVTADLLREYKELIDETTCVLKDLMDGNQERMRGGGPESTNIRLDELNDQQYLSEEQTSIQQCLQICSQVSEHIDQIRSSSFEDRCVPADTSDIPNRRSTLSPSKSITSDALRKWSGGIAVTRNDLYRLRDDVTKRITSLSSGIDDGGNEETQRKLQEEVESLKQCLAICTDATQQANHERVNVFEDIGMADDGQQVIVSTFGDLIAARRINVGARSVQILGQMSDESLQLHITKIPEQDFSQQKTFSTATEDLPRQKTPSSTTQDKRFEGRHGSGRKLA